MIQSATPSTSRPSVQTQKESTAMATVTAPNIATAVGELQRGRHLFDLDLSKLSSNDKKAVRTTWREIRKDRLAKMDKAGREAFRKSESEMKTERTASRGAAQVKVDRSWVEGIAAGLDRLSKAIAAERKTLTHLSADGTKVKVTLAEMAAIFATSVRKQIEKPAKSAELFLVVKIDEKAETLTAYDERFNTRKRAESKSKKLAGFLDTAGVTGYGFRVMSLDEARQANVADLKEDQSAAEASADQAAA